MPVKAVFLDIDNTLLDFDEYVRDAMRTGFPLFHIGSYEPAMFSVFNATNAVLWKQIEDGELTMEGLRAVRWNLIFQKLGLSYDGPTFERWFRERLFVSAIPVQGAMELLKSLNGSYRIFAASNGPLAQQLNRLKLAGMLPFFEQVFVSEALGVSKPDPAFFQQCLYKVNGNAQIPVKANECVMVGDSLRSDVSGALKAGMKAFRFLYPGTLTQKESDADILRLADLPALLRML